MRECDRRTACGEGRRVQYLLANPEPQDRTCNRPQKKSGAMDRVGRRDLGRAYRTRDNDRNDLRVAPQRRWQTAALVAAIHRDLLRVDGAAWRNLRLPGSAGTVGYC